MMYPNLVRDDELMAIWKDYWKKNWQWFYNDQVTAPDIKRLFDDYVESLMAEETKAMEKVLQFCEWDEMSEFVFNPDE